MRQDLGALWPSLPTLLYMEERSLFCKSMLGPTIPLGRRFCHLFLDPSRKVTSTSLKTMQRGRHASGSLSIAWKHPLGEPREIQFTVRP